MSAEAQAAAPAAPAPSPSSRGAALRCERLAKTFSLGLFKKRVRALEEVTLSVETGEIFGLLGPNGAGKTTTLKVLLGLVRPSSGRAELLGRPIGDVAAKRRLGYLPESPYFYDYLTGRELVVFMARLFGLSRREARRRADALLERVGLSRAAGLPLRRYSKGMLQRVGIAQALVNDPDLVILDEPLSGLDPLGRKDLRELIADLRREGKTVVFSSHILSDVELLADHVAVLVGGRTVSTGPLHELLDARILSTEILFAAPEESGKIGGLLADLEEAELRHAAIAATYRVVLEGAAPPDPVVDLVRRHGGRLLQVTPRKESLEDVVVGLARDRKDERGG
jgi:ABC-2 type transport system ATP-binding protein